MSNIKNVLTELEENQLWEMANFRSKSTGLPMNVYISIGEVEGKKMKHGARIKVSRSYANNFTPFDTFSITISNNPIIIGDVGNIYINDINKLKEFISKNYDVLLAYWDGEYDTSDLIGNLRKV